MLMLGSKGISSPPALSPAPANMTDLLGSEFGLWESETMNTSSKLESDLMELIDPNSTNNSAVMIASTSPCSSSPSSSPSSIILHEPCQSQTNDMLSGDNFSHHPHGMMLPQSQQQANNHEANSNNQASYTQYLTPLPALMMSHDQNPYSPTEVHMLENFNNCMEGTDYKLNDNFEDSYNFLSEEPHHQLHSMPGVTLNNHHHQHQSLENSQQQAHHQDQQHQQGITSQNNGSDSHVLGLGSAYQFNEPSMPILPHQSHHHQQQHVAATSTPQFQQYRGHEYNNNTWEEPSYYGGDYRFSYKGESPATSDSVSYTSVDSGVGSSKSSTDSISTSVFSDSHNKLVPPKRRVGRPPKKDKKQKKLEKKTGRLWEFIRDLLKNPEYCPSLVRWENPEEGHFRFVNSDQVAKLWGRLKGNPRMTYEKLSRAMRYYYKSKVFEPVLGRRLVYKFGFNATNWRPTNPNFSQKMFCNGTS